MEDITRYVEYIDEKIREEVITPPYAPPYYINWTDPRVLFDPGFQGNIWMKESETTAGGNISPDSDVSTVKNEGINVPIIRINGSVIPEEQINYMKIETDDILPTIALVIYDHTRAIRKINGPSWDNDIVVIITDILEGYHKKTNFIFYINAIQEFDDYVRFDGIYRVPNFNEETHMLFAQSPFGWSYKDQVVASHPICTLDTMIHIARKCNLGFAYTSYGRKRIEYDPPQDRPHYISDLRWRIVKHQTLHSFMRETLSYAGDPTHIFDAWVDVFGYLNCIDITYLFSVVRSNLLKQGDLAIWGFAGIRSNMDNPVEMFPVYMQRTISNTKMNDADHNLLFDEYEFITNNNDIYLEGTTTQDCMLSGFDDNTPTINNMNIDIESEVQQDKAAASKITFNRQNFLGFNILNSECTVPSPPPQPDHMFVPCGLPIPVQKYYIKKFFNKIRTRILKVKMQRVNLGLQRGIIVNVVFTEHHSEVIRQITPDREYNDSATGKLNPFTTARYYIDATEYEYKSEERKINQYLYLINLEEIQLNPNSKLNSTEKVI